MGIQKHLTILASLCVASLLIAVMATVESEFSATFFVLLVLIIFILFSILFIYKQTHSLLTRIDELAKATHTLGTDDFKLSVNNNIDVLDYLCKEIINVHQSVTDKQDELQIARDRAIELARIKTDFLSNMSHEIRTPMNGVMGLLEIIDSSALSELDKIHIKTAKESGELLIRIINDILDFSKLDSGKVNLESISFSLNGYINNTVQLITPIANAKGVTLDIQLDQDDVILNGDVARLKQVLTNLLSNAIKFTRTDGKITIRVKWKEDINQCAAMRIDVIDTGIGMTEQQARSVFEAFTQADGSISRKYGGTGLGLSISKQLMNLMGGDIFLKSTLGMGSTFWMKLALPISHTTNNEINEIKMQVGDIKSRILKDLLNEDESTKRDNAPEIHHKTTATSTTNTHNVLLVEDNKVNIMVAKGMFKAMEIKPDIALNGEEAINAMKEKDYDLIFMDCQMPVLDGYLATKIIRSTETRHIPIVAMTANAMKGDRQKCLDAGMDDYISKPVSKSKIQVILNDWLHHTIQ